MWAESQSAFMDETFLVAESLFIISKERPKLFLPQLLSATFLSFFIPLPKDVKECLLVISTQDVGNFVGRFSETETENIIKNLPTAGG